MKVPTTYGAGCSPSTLSAKSCSLPSTPTARQRSLSTGHRRPETGREHSQSKCSTSLPDASAPSTCSWTRRCSDCSGFPSNRRPRPSSAAWGQLPRVGSSPVADGRQVGHTCKTSPSPTNPRSSARPMSAPWSCSQRPLRDAASCSRANASTALRSAGTSHETSRSTAPSPFGVGGHAVALTKRNGLAGSRARLSTSTVSPLVLHPSPAETTPAGAETRSVPTPRWSAGFGTDVEAGDPAENGSA